ncbi:dihydrofolate reductase family protein [Nocardia sp. JMUB6875]|uniref:dihydrofolate reductase family protein n=1 Tax=Nocardia sp. JMUB6875 TaxID=3158170 RepID=UPI0032E71951
MRKLVYYVGVTLDGFIAGPEGQFDFFGMSDEILAWIAERYPDTLPTDLREHFGVAVDAPNVDFDTLVMGRGTYEPGLAIGVDSPYNHLKQYVFSKTLEPVDNPQVDIVSGDPVELVRRLKKEAGKNIWLCGGADLAGQLIDEIDQLVLKSYPVIAGAGIPVFSGKFSPARFTVTERREFASGEQVTWLDRA